jgi:hypothetical protein
MRAADGREVPLSLSVSPLRDDSGSIQGGICQFRI